jgi:hypothetical protein
VAYCYAAAAIVISASGLIAGAVAHGLAGLALYGVLLLSLGGVATYVGPAVVAAADRARNRRKKQEADRG